MDGTPLTAYTEVQIDDDSISLTLISESQDGARIEDTERFTFDELQEMSGEHQTLRLSDDTQSELSEQARLAMVGNLSEAMSESGRNLPEAGDPMVDDNAPSWSEDPRVIVTEVVEDVTCDEWVIEGQHEGTALSPDLQTWTDKTVADANPSYDSDEPVVFAKYADGDGDEYAFPASRLVEPDREHYPFPQAVPPTR